jgi:hypothetical protein
MKTSVLSSLALRAVLRPTFVLGGLAILAIPSLGVLALRHCPVAEPASAMVSLELDTPTDKSCYFESAFSGGPVTIERAAVEGQSLHFTQRYPWVDGCVWEAEETLVPHGQLFSYAYEEHVVSCEIGAEPLRACERHGVVTMRPSP